MPCMQPPPPIKTKSYIIPPYKWIRLSNRKVVFAANPDLFPYDKPLININQYYDIYNADGNFQTIPLQVRSRI